jgi:transferrin binding protein
MRPLRRFAIVLVPTLAACSSGGGSSTIQPQGAAQALPSAMRAQTYQALGVHYNTQSTPGFSGTGPATVTTSADGTSFQLLVNGILDSGAQVSFNQSLTLPPPGSSVSGALNWPTQNASLSHMAYGEWNANTTGLQNSPVGGFFAFGNATPGASIPTTGSATYTGRWQGLSNGVLSATRIDGPITGTALFTARTVGLSALDSTGAFRFGGTLSYAAGVNSLSGPIANGTGNLTGSASAQFFGPNAQELGGVFRLINGGGTPQLIGSFGMKQ